MAVGLALGIVLAPGVPHVLATGSPNWGPAYRTSIAPYTASCGSATDQSATINQAIADASANNPSAEVIIDPCPTGQHYQLNNPVTPKSNVKVVADGADLEWHGAGSSFVIGLNDGGSPLTRFEWHGGTIDCHSVAGESGMRLVSPQMNVVEDVHIVNCLSTAGSSQNAYGLGIFATATTGCEPTYLYCNAVQNVFRDVVVTRSTNGLFMQSGTGGGVTDNRFFNFSAWGIRYAGIREVDGDNNYFWGGLIGLASGSGVLYGPYGILLDETGAADNYNNSFYGYAISAYTISGATFIDFGPNVREELFYNFTPDAFNPGTQTLLVDANPATSSYIIEWPDRNETLVHNWTTITQ